MASPAVDSWWSDWLDAHGRDSEEEAAFLGYLSTQGISAHGSDVGTLAAAYVGFKAFMAESQATESADPGPSAMDARMAEPVVPKSHTAEPHMQRPVEDATHPQQMSSPGAPASARQMAAKQERSKTEEQAVPHETASMSAASSVPPKTAPSRTAMSELPKH